MSYNIVYAADDNFAMVLGVSIESLLKNNQNLKNINITIFDSGISNKNKNLINSIFVKYHRNLPKWIKPIDLEQKIGIKLDISRGSLAVYSRLFLQNFFDKDVEKILYIDSDTIINSSIQKLLDLSLPSKYIIAATKDAFSKYYRGNIELNPNEVMINAGVFLIDLKRWRKEKVENKFLNYIIKKNGKVQLNDQGVLNHVLNNKIYFLPPQFNMISLYYEYSIKDMFFYRKPVNFYSENEIANAKNNPVIIHYTSAFNTIRPWYGNSTHPLTSLWIKYYKESPWSGEPLKKEKKSGIKKILFEVYKVLPNKVSLFIASVFQAYIRPFFNRWN